MLTKKSYKLFIPIILFLMVMSFSVIAAAGENPQWKIHDRNQPLPKIIEPGKPGKWQTFDIIFHGPRFGPDKKLKKPANITVLHNGILTLDHVELTGPTSWLQRLPYRFHPEKLPVSIQDHGNPIRYRNIYVREIPAPGKAATIPREEVMPAGTK